MLILRAIPGGKPLSALPELLCYSSSLQAERERSVSHRRMGALQPSLLFGLPQTCARLTRIRCGELERSRT
ncbi:hypothetical protein MPLA_1360042 [Mesorhizobium sp. ORS 3359]|nr:hypothetical protein MPLA_1360042 [Mesorhizobium sp. ORS 3359]